jgi:hypothetical protein
MKNRIFATLSLITLFIACSLSARAASVQAHVPEGQTEIDSANHHTLEGSWIGEFSPGHPPSLFTFIKGGGVTATRPIIVVTPGGSELVSSGHGTWAHNETDQFSVTVLYLRSSPTIEFTGMVKVNTELRLDNDSDRLTGTSTVEIFDANGKLLLSFPLPVQMKRIAVED